MLKKLPDNPKGNPLEVARFAGITAAKRTSDLIPMCHPLMLSHVDVETKIESRGVRITARVSTTGQTGVEMEALTAAAVAALTVYDMTKALDKCDRDSRPVICSRKPAGKVGRFQKMIHVAILTISDSAVGGTREDQSGPALAECEPRISAGIQRLSSRFPMSPTEFPPRSRELSAEGKIDVAILTGGTGVAPRDVTPEAVRAIADREIPGFGELMRSEGRKSTKLAPLSRGGGFTRGRMLILALPGSPHGAVDSLNAVADLVPHVVDLLQGHTEHVEKPLS